MELFRSIKSTPTIQGKEKGVRFFGDEGASTTHETGVGDYTTLSSQVLDVIFNKCPIQAIVMLKIKSPQQSEQVNEQKSKYRKQKK